MKVWQLMTNDVETLDADATLDLADDLMRMKRIRHLPVMQNGELVGLVTQRDLFRAGLSSVLDFRSGVAKEWLRHIPVREVMVHELITISPDTDVEEAVRRMLNHKIGCLPVMAGSQLVGLISETDCLRYLSRILSLSDVKKQITKEEQVTELC